MDLRTQLKRLRLPSTAGRSPVEESGWGGCGEWEGGQAETHVGWGGEGSWREIGSVLLIVPFLTYGLLARHLGRCPSRFCLPVSLRNSYIVQDY